MFSEYIKKETLALELIIDETVDNPFDLNGHKTNIITKKA